MRDQRVPSGLEAYFAKSSVAIALSRPDPDHELVFVNPSFETLTGYSSADIVGKNCRMIQGGSANADARRLIGQFLGRPDQPSVRTPIVNFRRDGTPFVNLLYMAKLRDRDGTVRFIVASQFDVSRTKPELLAEYDVTLARTIDRMSPAFMDSGLVVDGSLMTIGNTVAMIAQAKLTLGDIDDAAIG